MMKTTKIQFKKLEEIYDDYINCSKIHFRNDVLQSESLLIAKVFANNNQETLLFQWFNNLISITSAIEKIIG